FGRRATQANGRDRDDACALSWRVARPQRPRIQGRHPYRQLRCVAGIRLQAGKFDYLSAPGHSAHSMASEFFTDDKVAKEMIGRRLSQAEAKRLLAEFA